MLAFVVLAYGSGYEVLLTLCLFCVCTHACVAGAVEVSNLCMPFLSLPHLQPLALPEQQQAWGSHQPLSNIKSICDKNEPTLFYFIEYTSRSVFAEGRCYIPGLHAALHQSSCVIARIPFNHAKHARTVQQ